MGFDCGFDIYPRLEVTPENKETYQRFIDDIIAAYKGVYDEEARRDDGKVLQMPTDSDYPDDWDKANIYFMVGECPRMPCNPERCNYFLRFSSKVSGRLTVPAAPYIRSVYKIAEKHLAAGFIFGMSGEIQMISGNGDGMVGSKSTTQEQSF